MSSLATRTAQVTAQVTAQAVRPPRTGPFSLVRILRTVVVKSAAIVAFLALWQAYPSLFPQNAVWLPSFTTVVSALKDLVLSGDLWVHVQASLTRSLSGFGLAILIAIPLGLLIGWYKPVADLLSPLLELFRNTAALAILPVFILILGLGEVSKISLVLYSCTWPILLNTIAGVKGVDPLLVKSAKSMGLGPLRLFQKVVLPAAVPTIFTGIRLAGAFSILVLIAAELVGAKEGLGFLIVNSQSNFAIPEMYAGILTTSILGVVFNQGLLGLERRFSTWRPQ